METSPEPAKSRIKNRKEISIPLNFLFCIYYNLIMYDVETTGEFDAWLESIRNGKTRIVIAKRIDVMPSGSIGETRSLAIAFLKPRYVMAPVTTSTL